MQNTAKQNSRWKLLNFFFLLVFLTGAVAHAASWKPTRPVEIVVGAAPGGGNDRVARIVQKVLQDQHLVPTSLVVMNKPGGDGVAAEGYLNAHQGDGHYILLTASGLLVNPMMGIGTVHYTDVTPISLIISEYAVVTGRTNLPYATPSALIAQIRKAPNSLSVAVAPGLGSSTQIGFAILAEVAGVDPAKLHIIPYSSAGQAVTAVIGQQIDLLPSTPGNVQGLIQANKLHAYGVLGPERLSGAMANIPTWKELGYNAVYDTWRGVVGPKNLPPEQAAYWDHVLAKMSATQEWKDAVGKENEVADYRNTKTFMNFLKGEDKRNREILGRINLLKEK